MGLLSMPADLGRVEGSLLQQLASLDIGNILWNEPLRNHSSWRIGGPADMLVEPRTVEQAVVVAKAAAGLGIPILVIGHGTNLLFSDQGVRGVVVKIGNGMGGIEIDGRRMIAEAGVWVPRLARLAGRHGISGLEHTAGIPGTLGGLVCMNGGSQRKGIASSIVRVWALSPTGEMVCLAVDDCGFSYRHSCFQDNGYIVLRVELTGPPKEPAQIRREMLEILRDRRKKFPLKAPSCGSVFLSDPEKYRAVGPPGKLIEEAGLKGKRIGDAQVSLKHANFIENLGNATAEDVMRLVKAVQAVVRESTGHLLAGEFKYVTRDGQIVSV